VGYVGLYTLTKVRMKWPGKHLLGTWWL
jgi:hypothetical protein